MNKFLNIVGVAGLVCFSGIAATLPILDNPSIFKIAGIGLFAGLCMTFREKKVSISRPKGWAFIKHGEN